MHGGFPPTLPVVRSVHIQSHVDVAVAGPKNARNIIFRVFGPRLDLRPNIAYYKYAC